MKSPPFGMDKEMSQVTTGPHYFNFNDQPNPYGRPDCFMESKRPCMNCIWKQKCKNAEGRT